MPGLDTGNTGFMLLCTSLVMLMTPGLAFFYGGLVGRNNVLAIMIQSFVSMGWTTVIWFAFGYSLCFSGGAGGIIGNLDKAFLNGVSLDSPAAANPSIPEIVFVAYQMMFAIITPALITGAFANRITFKAYMLFLTGWLILVYFPFVHMVWGGGLLQQWGVLDFAGGIVVHNIAGIAALASVLYVGRRQVEDRGPHSIPLVALGTGLLWFGWYGVQRGQRVQGRRHDRCGVPQHGSRGVVRRDRVARARVGAREAAELCGSPDRRRGRTGDGDARRRLRLAGGRRDHRARVRRRLLWRGRVQEPAPLGRRRSTCGASMGSVASSGSSCSVFWPRRRSTRTAPTGCWPATPNSSSRRSPRSCSRRCGPSCSRSGCCGSSIG